MPFLRMIRMARGDYPHAGDIYVELFAGEEGGEKKRVASGFIDTEGQDETEIADSIAQVWTGDIQKLY